MLPQPMKSLLLMGMVLAGLWEGAGARVAAAPEVGEQAPDFTLPSTTGEDISLKRPEVG